jgi:hypothetical protein
MADPVQDITINLPSKYASAKAEPTGSSPAPSLEWLTRTWTVTHSTLSMWRSARNVRISYTGLPPRPDGRARIDDLVEYQPTKKTDVLKTVEGVDTAATAGGASWDWRGKGWLFFVSSHWEVVAWGESRREDGEVERWAVTWFAPTVFTKEGVDVYCDRREGLSVATYGRIEEALRKVEAKELAGMVETDMRPVEIKLPWVEKK